MRSTMLATALLLGVAPIANAQSDFSAKSIREAETDFFTSSNAPKQGELTGDSFFDKLDEPPSLEERKPEPSALGDQSLSTFAPPPPSSTPSWATPQPAPLPAQAKPTSPVAHKPEAFGNNAQTAHLHIQGLSQWGPVGPSTPRPLLAYMQCNSCEEAWAGYNAQAARGHAIAHRHIHGTCGCGSGQSQLFGHTCAPGSCFANGSRRASVAFPSEGGSATSCSGGDCSTNTAPSPSACASSSTAPKGLSANPAMKDRVAESAPLWPLPSFLSKKNASLPKDSKMSQSNQAPPMTFR